MLTALAMSLLAPTISSGGYALPELCRQLSKATGVTCESSTVLSNYPVFVATKSGDPERVKQLIAAALHAEWQKTASGYRLTAIRPSPKPDMTEFRRLYAKATEGRKVWSALPPEELYRLSPGTALRFGPAGRPLVKPWDGPVPAFTVRKLSPFLFEGQGMDQVVLEGLPPAADELLKSDAKQVAFSKEEAATLKGLTSDPDRVKVDFTNLAKSDPIAQLAEKALLPVSKKLHCDLVVALGDASVMGMIGVEPSITIGKFLGGYAADFEWKVVDGAMVGQIPYCEQIQRTQALRPVIADIIRSMGPDQLVPYEALKRYVRAQNPESSASMGDAFLLLLGGVVLDDQFVGQYPFNIWLYTKLNDSDWRLIRAEQPFTADALSQEARGALTRLLLDSRDVGENGTDLGYWPSFSFSHIKVIPSFEESNVLIGFTSLSAEVYSPEDSALQYDMRKKSLGREPLYRPATRKMLRLKLQYDQRDLTETGFAELSPTPGTSKVPWNKLPEEIARKFAASLAKYRAYPEPTGGNPPP